MIGLDRDLFSSVQVCTAIPLASKDNELIPVRRVSKDFYQWPQTFGRQYIYIYYFIGIMYVFLKKVQQYFFYHIKGTVW